MNKATPEEIEAWKKEHGTVYAVTASEEDKIAYLRKPTRKELSFAGAAGAQEPMKFNESILNSCWLGGDEDIKTNDSLFLGLSVQLETVVSFAKFDLEKL